jgi:hypothetical protein
MKESNIILTGSLQDTTSQLRPISMFTVGSHEYIISTHVD